MTTPDPTQGLTCPQCGGVLPIPEGQVIVRCPYCDLRSFVQGERGLRRFQVSQNVPHARAAGMLKSFLKSNWAIARDAARRAELTEAFLVYLPFWTVWGRLAGWAFGQKQVGSGDHKRYEPREVRIVQEVTWNGAACDVGEFGVTEVPLLTQELSSFDPEALHNAGLVFEPAGSFSQAKAAAQRQFEHLVNKKAGLDRISQLFVRNFRQRLGLVYYPLWVLRYLYRGRSFQVVVDGHSGQVLYGKAPGNTLYRAAALVAGMAAGAFLAVDIPSFLLSLMRGDDSDGLLAAAGIAFLVGLGMMAWAYRTFRYGEQYEYSTSPSGAKASTLPTGALPEELEDALGMLTKMNTKDVEQWISKLS